MRNNHCSKCVISDIIYSAKFKMSENLFYFLNVCEKNGSKGFQYSKDSFSSKLFPSLNGNAKPRDFQNPMNIYDEIPQGFDRQLDLKNVDTEKLKQLLKIRLFINYRAKIVISHCAARFPNAERIHILSV